MHILDKIINDKRIEVAKQKKKLHISDLRESELFNAKRPSFYDALKKQGPSIIAEFKRKSPSRGIINEDSDPATVIRSYFEAGASAGSVLTDKYFSGSCDDLLKAFKVSELPLLRKDFIIDEYQIYEAKSFGASAILLIAAALSKESIKDFTQLAHSLSLDVLLEIHELREIEKYTDEIRIVGINNRNLKTFKVDTKISEELINDIPSQCIAVSESGISDADTIIRLHQIGFDAFLIGESFMQTTDPGKAAYHFIQKLKHLIISEDAD